MSDSQKKVDFIVKTAKKALQLEPLPAPSVLKRDRRVLLKWGLIGGGAFLLGKVFGPSVPFLFDDWVVAKKEFENFDLTETNKELTVARKDGEKIVIFEKR